VKIAIDLRSLSSGSISGVENYIVNLLESLLTLDNKNSYILFYNSWKDQNTTQFQFINSEVKRTRLPNKILNGALKLGLTSVERMLGPIDWFFMPNLNQYSVSSRTKLAITVHDLSPVVVPEFYDTRRRLWHKFLNYKKAFERADVIFAVSNFTKNDLIRLFNIADKKIKVVYPGIDHHIFNPEIPSAKLREARNLFGLPGEYFLFLSPIEPRKNLSMLVKAFDSLKSGTHLVIAGRKGWKYEKIFREISESKKLSKIKYLGYLEEEDKPAIIKLAKAVIYPSFYEGFGFVPLEAQSMGVPTIVSQVSALPEVVEQASLLIDPYSIGSLTRALEEIDGNENLRQMLISKGKITSQKFNWKNTATQVLQGMTN